MRLHLILIVTSIIMNSPLGSSQSAPVFLVHPQSVASVEGSTVMFTCTANNTEGIDYRVNETRADLVSVTSQGFSEAAAEDMGNNVIRRNLSVSVSGMINNSMIECEADALPGKIDVFSNTSILTVQGPLSSVVDLSYSFIDSSTVHISWSSPFTLPGTDITGYNVSATASNGTTANHFTSNSYYELSLTDITDSPCTEVIITVSGYNGLDGNSSFVTVPSPFAVLPVQLDYIDNGNALITINLTNTCRKPSSLAITLSNSSGSIIDTANITVPGGADAVTYNEFNIPDNMNYTVNVSYTVNGYTVITTIDIQGKGPVELLPTTASMVTSTRSGSSPPLSASSLSTAIGSTMESLRSTSISPSQPPMGSNESSSGASSAVISAIIIALIVVVAIAIICIVGVITWRWHNNHNTLKSKGGESVCYSMQKKDDSSGGSGTTNARKKQQLGLATAQKESYLTNTQQSPPKCIAYAVVNPTVTNEQPPESKGDDPPVIPEQNFNPEEEMSPEINTYDTVVAQPSTTIQQEQDKLKPEEYATLEHSDNRPIANIPMQEVNYWSVKDSSKSPSTGDTPPTTDIATDKSTDSTRFLL